MAQQPTQRQMTAKAEDQFVKALVCTLRANLIKQCCHVWKPANPGVYTTYFICKKCGQNDITKTEIQSL